MGYIKNNWVDQSVERPKTYEMTNNSDGSVTLIDSFGLVSELGTPVNADNMNHIEEGVEGCAIRKHNLAETFEKSEWVTGIVENEKGIYESLTDNNYGNPLTDTTNWKKVELGGGGLEVCDIGMALYVDETKGLRRYLNGQIVAINDNTKGFLEKLLKIKTLHPSLFTTESNWQAEKASSAYKQVGKFVLNYGSDTTIESVRIPAIVNIQGLLDLQNLGMTVKAGLPTLTTNSTGNHAHTRGTMDIVGSLAMDDVGDNKKVPAASGALTWERNSAYRDAANGEAGGITMKFQASRNWTGETSSNGNHSHTIQGTSNTVQEEAIQYPYFIQIATGSETEVDIVNSIELNNPYTLLESKYSKKPLYNLSWLEAGSGFTSKVSYPKVYEALQIEYNSEIKAGESSELPSGTTYIKRGLSVKPLSEAYTDYDFVINTSDETFRLPLKNHSADDNGSLSLYYYVGETVQNANLIDAAKLAEDIASVKANKADKSPWVSRHKVFIASETEFSTLTFSLADILPNDGNIYECLFYIEGKIKPGVTNNLSMMLSTSIDNLSGRILHIGVSGVSNVSVGGQFIALVGTNRQINITQAGENAKTIVNKLAMSNYRRID